MMDVIINHHSQKEPQNKLKLNHLITFEATESADYSNNKNFTFRISYKSLTLTVLPKKSESPYILPNIWIIYLFTYLFFTLFTYFNVFNHYQVYK